MMFLKELEEIYRDLVSLGAKQILIGSTVMGRKIYAFKVGNGKKRIIAQYAIHAREYITFYLAVLHIQNLLKNPPKNYSIYFIPIVNIDGVEMVKNSQKVQKYRKKYAFYSNFDKNFDFSQWKANVRGVDLNVNFPARFATGKSNIDYPNFQNYVGKYPASEPETSALIDFTLKMRPILTLSFHSKGEVIYYDFHQSSRHKRRDKKIAQVIALSTGYKIKRTGRSAGGYKDWCISALAIPSLTIEVGSKRLNHPIKVDNLYEIWDKTKFLYDDLLYFLDKISYNL